ncbi:MAG TPA: iron-containing redox enzyme family protein [Thermoleophilaceae bacterium]|nr:iron-containing redox enzyme family protein [Thermoleophilaceae bacterium]
MPVLPPPRGPLTEALFATLAARPPGDATWPAPAGGDPVADEDLQLALYACYELHYRGFDGVAGEWEWDPGVLTLRARLERAFEEALREAAGPVSADVSPESADVALRAIADADDGPSLSLYIARDGTRDQLLELLVHRSAYQLKEADPHTWALPRLTGEPKAAMVEIQADEYGGGRPERIHADMFARAMEGVGLDGAYGAYLHQIPAVMLATVNLMSFLGLHRRLRGALAGHLALFEMSSAVPSKRYADAMRRLGWAHATGFYDEHVEADSVHENIAAVHLAGGLIRQDPRMGRDVLFGAQALAALDRRWADHVFARWEAGLSSLLEPLADPVSA